MSAYLLIHLYYTVPVALVLHYILRPLRNDRDVFKTVSLICIAVIYTMPWDSYLIRSKIWSYERNNVVATIWSIPLEEYFFFVIQTYMTSSLYIILSKPIFFPLHLNLPTRISPLTLTIALTPTFLGILFTNWKSETTYLGWILLWFGPIFAFFILTISASFLNLPWYLSCGTILMPTIYLCIVDNVALYQGVWKIEESTKLNYQIFGSLDIEEALFFLLTNTMICLGLVACDIVFAVMDILPETYSSKSNVPSIRVLKSTLLFEPLASEWPYVKILIEASSILKSKSKSFHFASMVFPSRCRVSLVSIYAVCRVMDDSVDEALNAHSAENSLKSIKSFIDTIVSDPLGQHTITETDPLHDKSALMLLPRILQYIPVDLFTQLIKGFETDIQFFKAAGISEYPVQTEDDLIRYSKCVASTVAQMFLHAIWNAERAYPATLHQQKWILKQASEMGVALQLINIARDIIQDACNGRLYIPLEWADSPEARLELEELLKDPRGSVALSTAKKYSLRLIQMARSYYQLAEPALAFLPPEYIKAARLTLDVYMAIGGEIIRRGGDVSERALVKKARKVQITTKALYK